MQLFIYHQNQYYKSLIDQMTDVVKQMSIDEEPVKVVIVFDEFGSMAESSLQIVSVSKLSTGNIVVSSERNQQVGWRHTGQKVFQEMVLLTEPDLVAVDRSCLKLADDLSVFLPNRSLANPGYPHVLEYLQYSLDDRFSIFLDVRFNSYCCKKKILHAGVERRKNNQYQIPDSPIQIQIAI